jgi:hypothetical protein
MPGLSRVISSESSLAVLPAAKKDTPKPVYSHKPLITAETPTSPPVCAETLAMDIVLCRRKTYDGIPVMILADAKGQIKGRIWQKKSWQDARVTGLPAKIDTDQATISRARKTLAEDCWYGLQFGDIDVRVRVRGGAPQDEGLPSFEAYEFLEQQAGLLQRGRWDIVQQNMEAKMRQDRRYPQPELRSLDQRPVLKAWTPAEADFTFKPAAPSVTEYVAETLAPYKSEIIRALKHIGIPAALVVLGKCTGMAAIVGAAGGIAYRAYKSYGSDAKFADQQVKIEAINQDIDALKDQAGQDEEMYNKFKDLIPILLLQAQGIKLEAQDVRDITLSPGDLERTFAHLKDAAAKTEVEEHFKLVMIAGQTAVDLSAQIIAFKDPDLAHKISVVGTAALTVHSSVFTLKKLGASAGMLATVGPVGAMASALLTVGSLFLNSQQTPEQVISRQIQALAEYVSDFRQEMHTRFDQTEKMLGILYQDSMRGFRQLTVAVTKLQSSVDSCYQAIDSGFRGSTETRLAHFIEMIRRRPYDRQTFIGYVAELQTWASKTSKTPLLTGSGRPRDSITSIVRELDGQIWENRFGYLANLAQLITSDRRFETDLANPIAWSRAADAYMEIRSKYPDLNGVYDRDVAQLGYFKEMIQTGLQLREFIRSIQTNEILFEKVFERYTQSLTGLETVTYAELKTALDGDSRVKSKNILTYIQALDINYRFLQAFIYLGVHMSFNLDYSFRSLISPDVPYAYRLIGQSDIVALVRNITLRKTSETHCRLILSQLPQKVERLKFMLLAKIAASREDQGEPYGLVEFMLDKLCAFGRDHYAQRRSDQRWNRAVALFYDEKTMGQAGRMHLTPLTEFPRAEAPDPNIFRSAPTIATGPDASKVVFPGELKRALAQNPITYEFKSIRVTQSYIPAGTQTICYANTSDTDTRIRLALGETAYHHASDEGKNTKEITIQTSPARYTYQIINLNTRQTFALDLTDTPLTYEVQDNVLLLRHYQKPIHTTRRLNRSRGYDIVTTRTAKGHESYSLWHLESGERLNTFPVSVVNRMTGLQMRLWEKGLWVKKGSGLEYWRFG